MIEIKQVKDCDERPAVLSEKAICYAAKEDGKTLGWCSLEIKDAAVITGLCVENGDELLADGIVRAALWGVSDMADFAVLGCETDIKAIKALFSRGGENRARIEDIFKTCR